MAREWKADEVASNVTVNRMIRIAITQAAFFEAIARTLRSAARL